METPPQPSGTPSSTNDDDHLAFRDISTTLDDTQPPRQPPQQLRIADITQWRDRDASCFSLRGNPQLSTGTHPNPSWRNTSEQDQRRRRHPKLCSPPQSTKQESRSRALEALEIILGGATTVSVVWLHHHNCKLYLTWLRNRSRRFCFWTQMRRGKTEPSPTVKTNHFIVCVLISPSSPPRVICHIIPNRLLRPRPRGVRCDRAVQHSAKPARTNLGPACIGGIFHRGFGPLCCRRHDSYAGYVDSGRICESDAGEGFENLIVCNVS